MEDTVEKENIIEFKNISKTFRLKNSEVQALKDVSTSGTVTVKGKNVLELKGRELRSNRKNWRFL